MSNLSKSSGSLENDLQVVATARLMEALVESENHMRMRIDLLSEVVFELDENNNFVFLNNAWFIVLGIKTDSVLGKSLFDFILENDRPNAQAFLMDARVDSRTMRETFRFISKDHTIRWLEMSVVTRPQGGYVGTLTDVTAQKQTQDELERMSIVANYTDKSVIITNANGQIEWVNKAFTRNTGYVIDEIIGKIPGHFLQGPETSMDEVDRIRQKLKALESFQSEILNYTRSGEPFWNTIYVSPVIDSKGMLQHYVAVQSDTSELRKANEALHLEKARAEAANLAKSDFLSTMSHELRTPLNGILGMAQLLAMPGISSDEHHEFVEVIRNSGQLLLGILNDILELSKIESGKIELRSGSFSLQQMLTETRMLYSEPAWSKGLAIDVQWHSNDNYEGDALRIKQILNNLVSNAIKFTSSGSVSLEAREISRKDRDVCLEFIVADTGIGIPLDKHELLFKPFSQIDNSTTRKVGGTGLGLSIVHRLAQLMGGEVQLESDLQKGTRVTVRIMAKASTDDTNKALMESIPQQRGEVSVAASVKVLIVEDIAMNALLLKAFFKRLGLNADHVINGQEAIDYVINKQRPDIIFMDCQMPVMDGFEATRLIRQYEKEIAQSARIPIVALTARVPDILCKRGSFTAEAFFPQT